MLTPHVVRQPFFGWCFRLIVYLDLLIIFASYDPIHIDKRRFLKDRLTYSNHLRKT